MGLVYANIVLKNAEDLALVKHGYLKIEDIRQLSASMLVNSGSNMMAINEIVKTQLGLNITRKQIAQLANGSLLELGIVGPIEINFENRRTICEAMVLPGDVELLLGAIPMEAMDVVIDVTQSKLIVNPLHPNIAQLSLK
jgi:hypothetical protein